MVGMVVWEVFLELLALKFDFISIPIPFKFFKGFLNEIFSFL